MARVLLTDDAKDDIRDLDGSAKARVLSDLKKLETSPADRGQPLGARDMGNLTGLRKLKIGPRNAYRAVYATEGDAVAVVIVVGARSQAECYQLALTRIRLLADTEERSEVTGLLMSIIGERKDG
ncbi:MAG: type II toxin-antitoxin system RelE/ParE family toxin [Mycobacteriaceae bacterium]|nr:type II toxin-antitoxin system RelE/ParE family toxin [Mycobacteriaceae bacterium]